MFTIRALRATSLLALVGLVAVAFGEDNRAMKYMVRYFRSDYNFNVVAILHETTEDKGNVQLKLQRSKDGKLRHTILSPLHMQGEFLDDGKVSKRYLPDDRIMFVQPSIPAGQEAGFRLSLVEKNYKLKSETGKKIAGRKCVTVTAESKYDEVPSVRYYFDESTGFPMSMETVLSDGRVLSGYEITDIKFPAKIDDSIFTLEPVAGVEIVNYREQKSLTKLADAEPSLGFTPVVPQTIPFGFRVQKITVSSNGGCPVLCLKMTDGIQRATVYEWMYVPGEKVKTGEASSFKIAKGLKITIVCDLGTTLRESFLRPFMVRVDQNPAILTSVGF